ncbi:MAG TPA: PaaI family thioesterase [Dehalococcoidia bacterium]|nr:PaaI family thioesterase [Dehalococcoidia bacterium]
MTESEWLMRRVPFIELVGAELEEMREGYGRLALIVEEKHTNPNGVMHGGVATTLMDLAAAIALGALRGEAARQDSPHATVEMNASLIAAVRPGEKIVIEGRVLSLRRSVAFCESEVRKDSDGDLLAKGRFTFSIRARRG